VGDDWSVPIPTSSFHNATTNVALSAVAIRDWLTTEPLLRASDRGYQQRATNRRIEGTRPVLADRALRPGAQLVVGMQKWVGRITEVDSESLTAELYSLDEDAEPIVAD
jgi:hypothetical protein